MALQIVNRDFTDYQGRTLSFPFFQGVDSVIAKYTLEVDFSIQLSITNQMQVIGNTLSLTNGSWEEIGFFAGASISGTYQHSTGGVHSIPASATVVYVDGAIMTITFPSGTMVDGMAQSGLIRCDEIPNAFEFEFNLVSNNGSATNQFSLIDGEVNRFQALTDSMAVSDIVDFDRLGNFSGGSFMQSSIERIADVSGRQRFEISIFFRNWTIKDLDLFLTTNCVKPWIRFKVFPEYQNPTVFISLVNTPSDAQTGGFNEVGNGGIPDYSLASVSWENESAEVLPTFDYSQASKFTAVIDGTFTSSSKFNIAWYFDSQEDSDYKNLPTTLDENLMLLVSDTPLIVGSNSDIIGNTRVDGSGLELQEITISQSGTSAIIEGKFVPNSQFTSFIESKENFNKLFRLSIRVENPTLTDNFIRPVWLDVDSQIMTKQIIPLGEYGIKSFDLFGHPENNVSKTLFIEDDFKTITTLQLPTFNDYNSINLGLVALNISTGERFIIESSSCLLDGFPILVDGSKPIFKQIDLPIKLSPDNNHKYIIWERDTSLDDTNLYGIKLTYSSVIDWKYWIEQLNANIEFYPNQNRDLLNYVTSDWTILFAVQIDTPLGQYENGFFFEELRNYNDWNGSTNWEYFKEDMTPVSKPASNEITIIKATHTNIYDFNPDAEFWGQMTVEPFESSPRWDISSAYDFAPNPSSPLIPLDSETRLKIEFDGNTMITWCKFDPSKLANNSNISFTSRIYNRLVDKDSDAQNRNKITVKTVKFPKDETPEKRLETDNCCDCIWDVFADIESTTSYKNHVSSRWVTAENVIFRLYKDGVLSAFQPSTQGFTNDTDSFYCTITWHDVIISDGQGCYVLKAELETAGVEFEKTLGTFNLLQFDWELARKKTMIRSVFNDANLKEEINFTNSNVVDCIMFDGDVEEFQPNTDINNLVFSDYSQNKVKRENLTNWTVNVNPSGYCLINRLINLHLVGENELFISDYRYDAFDKTILDKPCILSETPQMTPLYSSEKQKSTFKVQEKVVKNLTKYGSVEASKEVSVDQLIYPNTIASGGEDANYNLLNSADELISSGTIASGDTADIVAPNGVVTVKKSDGTTIQTQSVTSNGTANSTVSDSVITLKDTSGTTISTTNVKATDSENITAPNGTVVIKNSGGAVISSQSVKSNGSQDYIVANSVVVLQDSASTMIDSFNLPATSGTTRTVADSPLTVNGSSIGGVKATATRNLFVKLDGANAGTWDGANTINLTSPSPKGAQQLKTFQTTSYATGDDGNIQSGRGTSHLLLGWTNKFGNNNRFTDTLGGQTYANNIVLDNQQDNGTSIMGYYKSSLALSNDSWANNLTYCNALNTSGFNGWRMSNVRQLEVLMNYELSNILDFAPFNAGGATVHSATTFKSNTALCHALIGQYIGVTTKSAGSGKCLPCRRFTYAELGL